MSEHTCEVCGVTQLPLGWPTPKLCGACGRKRDMKEPKACPFCGVNAQFRVKSNDSTEFWLVCAVCHAQGPKVGLEGLAIYEWNRRRA